MNCAHQHSSGDKHAVCSVAKSLVGRHQWDKSVWHPMYKNANMALKD